MELTGKQRAFLNNLADLCEEYQAGFGYTVDDDGIPVRVAGPALTPRDAVDDVLAGLGAERRDVTVISASMVAALAGRAVAAGRELTGPEPLYLRTPDVTLPAAPKRVGA